MDKWDSFLYLKKADRLTQQLRSRCLGHDKLLVDILPESCRELPADRQAMHLARQILFQLAEQCPSAVREEFERSWQWLYAIVLYVLRFLNAEEQTFGSFLKIAGMDYFARHSFFKNVFGIDDAIREDMTQPEPMEQLEEAVLTLLDANGLLENGKALIKRMEWL